MSYIFAGIIIAGALFAAGVYRIRYKNALALSERFRTEKGEYANFLYDLQDLLEDGYVVTKIAPYNKTASLQAPDESFSRPLDEALERRDLLEKSARLNVPIEVLKDDSHTPGQWMQS